MRMRLLVSMAITLMLALASAASAQADSVVYIQAGNVFVANGDGSNPHQVTSNGQMTPGASLTDPPSDKTAYRSPTEADDGTIVAAKGGELIRMLQNGVVLNHFIPDTGGYPLASAVSPDGTTIAYNYSEITHCTVFDYNCGYYPQPGADVTPSNGSASNPASIQENVQDGRWIDNSTLVLQTDTSNVYYETLGSNAAVWFDPSGGLGYGVQPVVSRSGQFLTVVLRSTSTGGNPSAGDVLEIFKVNGAPPTPPTLMCSISTTDSFGFEEPDLAPDGSSVIWYDSAGEEAAALDPTVCTGGAALAVHAGTPILPGASQASYSTAADNPPPLPPAGGGGGGGGGPVKKLTASLGKIKAVKRAALLKHGVKVKLTCSSACSYTVAIRAGNPLARKLKLTRSRHGSITLGVRRGVARGAPATVAVKLGARARRALRSLRFKRIVLILEIRAHAATGRTVIHDYRLTIGS